MKYNEVFRNDGLIKLTCQKFSDFQEIFENENIELIDDYLVFSIGHLSLMDELEKNEYVNLFYIQSKKFLSDIKKTLSKEYDISLDSEKETTENGKENFNETKDFNSNDNIKKSVYDDSDNLIKTNENERTNKDIIENERQNETLKTEKRKNGNLTNRIKNELDLRRKNLFIDIVKNIVIKSITINIF